MVNAIRGYSITFWSTRCAGEKRGKEEREGGEREKKNEREREQNGGGPW